MDSPAIIGFWGGMALLISSITGPGLTTIPLLFQEAGWFTPTLAFLVFGAIAGLVSLFLVETMSTIHGNESFQSRVEYATVAHLYLGNKTHFIMQILLFCALQSVNLSSIIISEQTMDSLLIKIFHKTCAISFTEGAICVSEMNPSGSPFNSYILVSLGYVISAVLVIPLSMMTLVGNIKFQLASVAALFFVMISWIAIFVKHGLNQSIPAIGDNQSSLVGFVLNNFAFITTVPSFINELSRTVSIHRVISYPIAICVVLYLIVGLLGAASFKTSSSTDILATLAAADENKVLTIIVNILFPVSVLVTSVPVFAIVIRYNLVRGNVCSERYAKIWASWLPWVLIIPFQTKGWLLVVMNWTSLIFGSSTNFIIPLLFYLTSKKHSARTANATGALAPGDVFILYEDRRSTHIVQRDGDPLPAIITSSVEDDARSARDARSSPLLTVYPPASPASSSRERLTQDADALQEKGTLEEVDLGLANGRQEGSSSSLDPSSIPLRVVYSPAVSRSGSVTHADRPSIVLTRHDGPGDTTQTISAEDNSVISSRLRSNSFEARSMAESTVYRRSNNTPTASIGDPSPATLSTPPAPAPVLGSSNRNRRLTIEEVAEEPPGYEPAPDVVFRAFPEKSWWSGIVIARIALVVVTAAVLGNLIYTIIQTARGNSPLAA